MILEVLKRVKRLLVCQKSCSFLSVFLKFKTRMSNFIIAVKKIDFRLSLNGVLNILLSVETEAMHGTKLIAGTRLFLSAQNVL